MGVLSSTTRACPSEYFPESVKGRTPPWICNRVAQIRVTQYEIRYSPVSRSHKYHTKSHQKDSNLKRSHLEHGKGYEFIPYLLSFLARTHLLFVSFTTIMPDVSYRPSELWNDRTITNEEACCDLEREGKWPPERKPNRDNMCRVA